MITNINEFRQFINESTDLSFERKKEILNDLKNWSGGYDPTELPWDEDESDSDQSLNVFMDNYIIDSEIPIVSNWFQQLIDGNDLVINYYDNNK